MHPLLSHPLAFFPFVLVLFLAGSFLGSRLRVTHPEIIERDSSSLKALEGSVLGLLALLIGFTFSMAVSRYDLHIQLEVEEANAISSVWQRADTLPGPERAAMQQLLRQYVPVRLAFAETNNAAEAQTNLEQTAALQSQMWTLATASTADHRDPVTALFLSALGDAIDITDKRAAALENRIPSLAWAMLLFMGFIGSVLVGVSITSRSWLLLCVVPLVVAVVLTLVLDLDSPHEGFITVNQSSMMRTAAQVK